MNIFKICLLLLLLWVFINIKCLTKNNYKILAILFIGLVCINYNREHFFVKMKNNMYLIPDSQLVRPKKLIDPEPILTNYEYIISYDIKEPFTIVKNGDYVFATSNIFRVNSRQIERLNISNNIIGDSGSINCPAKSNLILDKANCSIAAREHGRTFDDRVDLCRTDLSKNGCFFDGQKYFMQSCSEHDANSYTNTYYSPICNKQAITNNNDKWEDPIEFNELSDIEVVERFSIQNRYGTSSITYKDITYFAGGFSYNDANDYFSNDITIYDLKWGIWYDKTFPSTESKTGVSTYAYKDFVIFAGGFLGKTGTLAYSNKVELYNTNKGHYSKNNAWSIENLPSIGRTNITIGAINDKLIFCGGFNDGFVDNIDIYNINESGYKWTTIKLPQNLVGLYLNMVSLTNTCILATGKTYPYNINLDDKLIVFMNNQFEFTDDNRFNYNKKIISCAIADIDSYVGKSLLINNWVTDIYDTFYEKIRNSFLDNSIILSIVLWVKINPNSDNVPRWLLKNNNNYIPNLVVQNNKIYPVLYVDNIAFRKTEGIPITNDWMNICLTYNFNEHSYLYLDYHTRIKFDTKPKLQFNKLSKGIVINNLGTKLNIESTDKEGLFWADGKITQMKFYHKFLNDTNVHNNFMLNYERFHNFTNTNNYHNNSKEPYFHTHEHKNQHQHFNHHDNLSNIEAEHSHDHEHPNKISEYISDNHYNLVYSFDGKEIKNIDTLTIFSHKYLFNLVSGQCNKRYGLFIGNELYKLDTKYKLRKLQIIYDSETNIWKLITKTNDIMNISDTDNLLSTSAHTYFSTDNIRDNVVLAGYTFLANEKTYASLDSGITNTDYKGGKTFRITGEPVQSSQNTILVIDSIDYNNHKDDIFKGRNIKFKALVKAATNDLDRNDRNDINIFNQLYLDRVFTIKDINVDTDTNTKLTIDKLDTTIFKNINFNIQIIFISVPDNLIDIINLKEISNFISPEVETTPKPKICEKGTKKIIVNGCYADETGTANDKEECNLKQKNDCETSDKCNYQYKYECEPCPKDYFNDIYDSNECKKCSKYYHTDGKTGQSACEPKDSFFTPERKIETSTESQIKLKKQLEEYNKQRTLVNDKNTIINELKKNLLLISNSIGNKEAMDK